MYGFLARCPREASSPSSAFGIKKEHQDGVLFSLARLEGLEPPAFRFVAEPSIQLR